MKGCGIAAGADGSSDNLLGERPKGHQAGVPENEAGSCLQQ